MGMSDNTILLKFLESKGKNLQHELSNFVSECLKYVKSCSGSQNNK